MRGCTRCTRPGLLAGRGRRAHGSCWGWGSRHLLSKWKAAGDTRLLAALLLRWRQWDRRRRGRGRARPSTSLRRGRGLVLLPFFAAWARSAWAGRGRATSSLNPCSVETGFVCAGRDPDHSCVRGPAHPSSPGTSRARQQEVLPTEHRSLLLSKGVLAPLELLPVFPPPPERPRPLTPGVFAQLFFSGPPLPDPAGSFEQPRGGSSPSQHLVKK